MWCRAGGAGEAPAVVGPEQVGAEFVMEKQR